MVVGLSENFHEMCTIENISARLDNGYKAKHVDAISMSVYVLVFQPFLHREQFILSTRMSDTGLSTEFLVKEKVTCELVCRMLGLHVMLSVNDSATPNTKSDKILEEMYDPFVNNGNYFGRIKCTKHVGKRIVGCVQESGKEKLGDESCSSLFDKIDFKDFQQETLHKLLENFNGRLLCPPNSRPISVAVW